MGSQGPGIRQSSERDLRRCHEGLVSNSISVKVGCATQLALRETIECAEPMRAFGRGGGVPKWKRGQR